MFPQANMAVEAVRFSFMSDQEVRSHSIKKITNTNLLDTLNKPIPDGLYDPALGPPDDISTCGSCGQRSFHCPGHCGHIDLVSVVYNPLLFNLLGSILSNTCFTCFQFRSPREQVDGCVYLLERLKKGDILGARRLRLQLSSKSKGGNGPSGVEPEPEDSLGSHSSNSVVLSETEDQQDGSELESWDSFQLNEAMSVINEFLRKRGNMCKNCETRSPKLTKPTFGWFHVEGLPNVIRSESIRRSGLGVTHEEDASLPEVVNADSPSKKVSVLKLSRYSEDNEKQKSRPLLPSEVREIMRQLWENEPDLCSYICDIHQQKCQTSAKTMGYSIFFLETVLVPPTKFRPAARAGDAVMEHPHTVLLGKVLLSNVALGNAHVNNTERSKMIARWMELQQSINILFDSKTGATQAQREGASGICQFLEKKEGVFRQKMMGKRVNFACRSVISPDPYLAVNEIGIPPYFALRLTYPEKVTPWNVKKLKTAVVNGPEMHPGATTYVDSVATVKLSVQKKARIVISRKLPSSRGECTQTEKNQLDFEGKVVYRHLQDGDIVLVNRQPTLHKPSIMAHVVRVLKGERTLRMHYANCSSYNADFDGDEINVHFPQDELSRAEAYNIVNANEQYIVPTRGDTVRGLIQDHIVAAVLLTLKSTFLSRGEFSQLLYGSGVFALGIRSDHGDCSRKVSLLDSEGFLETILPTIWKPEPLWTGKQVITALLNYITRGSAPCIVKSQAKLPKSYFSDVSGKQDEDEDQNAENNLVVWKNELVRGVIDKAQFGKYGLVHTVQELYGSERAGILLSALSRLFTVFLQIHGFTCGVDDLMILPHYDEQRKEKLEEDDIGEEVHCDFVKFKPGQIGFEELQLEIEKVLSRDKESATAFLDMKMKNKLTSKLTREGSQVLKHLLTDGLLKPFPKNCISVMTTTGAKGSTVNFQQISGYLGQQELEGKRVPRMVSGKTLPCFPPWDYTSRAGGFITDRFLSGLRPQEYYFHCMAGREGLVDTAVKTSRSGYLQRCLVKSLESLKIGYDYTVRDADGSIIQFYYGEDGVDPHKTSFLKNFKALADNKEIIQEKFQNKHEFPFYINKLPEGLEEEARCFAKEAYWPGNHAVNSSQDLNKSRGKSKRRPLDMHKATAKDRDRFVELLVQKYLSSLAPAGEPVGVIAAQSIGEPSTQMTLNTFHLAGRGEMNVTLGIPRLQEILMTASEVIKTPVVTCPFSRWTSKDEAVAVISKLKKVTIADLIDSMHVEFSYHDKEVARIYKLKMELRDTKFVSLGDLRETLKSTFRKEMEAALESHIAFLSRINSINNVSSSSTVDAPPSDVVDDESSEQAREAEGGDADDNSDKEDEDDGMDAEKRRQQKTDEMDYEDTGGKEESEGDLEDDADNQEGDEDEDENEDANEKENLDDGTNDEVNTDVESTGEMEVPKSEEYELCPSDKKPRLRGVFMKFSDWSFEVHFKLTSEPHILLAQIAQKAAKKVLVNKCGKLSQCKLVQHDPDEKTVIWNNKKKQKDADSNKNGNDDDDAYWAVKASGLDLRSFWETADDLDLSRLYTNNIYGMLQMYGVEAARASIIREMKHVFDIYGVKIDYRHLSLIADRMTHNGEYTGMSRHGCIAHSNSPFLKMSFETASKFIVEAATYGLTDNLETPSSRIILGLPVNVGTGSFEVLQKFDD